jgi:protein-S-isoprenylcysteine O-methyltransferase Ste14
MPLKEEFETTGNLLFRRRSYLTTLLLVIGIIILTNQNLSYPFENHTLDLIWELFCFSISILGLFIRGLTIAFVPRRTSGRNTHKGQVADTLNTTGMYSIVRHPLYLGNFLIFLGILLFPRVWWFIFVYVLTYVIFYERIMFAEEEFLRNKFRQKYLEWSQLTPAIIPNITLWKPPSLEFSYKSILKKEYITFFIITTAFTFLEIVQDFVITGKFVLDPLWCSVFVFGVFTFIILRILRKRTHILHANDR